MKPVATRAVMLGLVYEGWEIKVRDGCLWFFGFTPEKHGASGTGKRWGRLGFWTGAFRYVREASDWVGTRTAMSASRWRARDRAWRWFCEKDGRRFRSLHRPKKMTARQRARLVARLPRRNA